jgi:hypothetical protein
LQRHPEVKNNVRMTRSVRLERLPEGLVFPAEMAARISFAPNTHELRFEGFMSKTDFDKLLRLSNDLAYQRALEQLFQRCTFRDAVSQPTSRRSSGAAWVGVGGAVAASVVAVVAWSFYGRSQSPQSTPPQSDLVRTAGTPLPVADGAPAMEIKQVNHLVGGATSNDSKAFDGEIKP